MADFHKWVNTLTTDSVFRDPWQGARTRLRRLGVAAYDLRRFIVFGVALTGLLLKPRSLPIPITPIVFGVPLAISALRPGESRAFRLWALYVGSFLCFWVLRNLADDIGGTAHFQYAIAFDRWLFGEVPSVALQARWYHGTMGRLEWLAVGTYYSYFVIPPLALAGMWLALPSRFPRYVVASVLLFSAAVVVHAIVPTAPPWLAAREGYLPPIAQLMYQALELALPSTVPYGSDMLSGNYVAAMPSVHMGVAWLLVLALATTRTMAAVACGYAALMLFSIVYTGDHYVADAAGAVVLASVCWVIAARLERGHASLRPLTPDRSLTREAA